MVRITKTMQAKHSESLSPFVKDFRSTACSTSLAHLPPFLDTFPTRWPFPRGDLYHWIPLLNRFDIILENFCKTYKLDEGPQTTDFGCLVLQSGSENGGETLEPLALQELGYSTDGDRRLVEAVLNFSRILLQNCGNRSVYASSSHLNSLLNTTSLSLLEATLKLGSQLAQRYQAAVKRMNMPARNVSSALLANHYNIDLDRVLKLARPFARVSTYQADLVQPATPLTPSAKGKEKAYFGTTTTPVKAVPQTIFANDLVSLAKGGNGAGDSPKGGSAGNGVSSETDWEEWGDVKVTYYPRAAPPGPISSTQSNARGVAAATPGTPTPIRRTSNLGPHGHRSHRQSNSDDSPTLAARVESTAVDDTLRPNFVTIEITSSKLRSAGIHEQLREHLPGLPHDSQYELLTKLRVADALTSSLATRRHILAVRLLALTNLAYIYSEVAFNENVLKQDSDEPRRLQLTYQLAELVHPPADGDIGVPQHLQTLAFSMLDALTNHQTKFSDVCSALNTNVNHGVLLYVIRKAVAGLNAPDEGEKLNQNDEWREALFNLVGDLCINLRTGADLVTAGLIPILVEVLGLRTSLAERYYLKMLSFLESILYSARDAFQTLVGANGLDAVSNLIVYEVANATNDAFPGKLMHVEYRSAAVDYEIPYFQQQTLKGLFKFTHKIMSTAGAYGGNFDRLLRNLMDSSPLLGSLRQIIGNAKSFGSVLWMNAVSILIDFINNEPTSFAVIAEAGLTRGLLEAVTCTTIAVTTDASHPQEEIRPSYEPTAEAGSPSPSQTSDDDNDGSDDEPRSLQRPSLSKLQAPRELPLARGILPTPDTISIVPQAFSAICLNNAGMKMFQASKALESFMEIFESPEHVRCMDTNRDLPQNLGSTFDELVRHHPTLKPAIMSAVVEMVARVGFLCKQDAEKNKSGVVLLVNDVSGNPIATDDKNPPSTENHSAGKGKEIESSPDVEMLDVDAPISSFVSSPTSSKASSDPPMTTYIGAVANFLLAMFSNTSVRTEFTSRGGIEYIIDLAHSPCISCDFSDGSASRNLKSVISLLAEQKPHLTIPSLLRRAQAAADQLAPFAEHQNVAEGFFVPFVDAKSMQIAPPEFLARGNTFAKALTNLGSLISTLESCFQATAYNHRSASTGFNQLNLSDHYVRLVHSLGPLLSASVRERIYLAKCVPSRWETSFATTSSAFSLDLADAMTTIDPDLPSAEPDAAASVATDRPLSSSNQAPTPSAEPSPAVADLNAKFASRAERDSSELKNFKVLRHLINNTARSISPFFQTLGRALVTKRNIEPYMKQGHSAIAEALADVMLSALKSSPKECELENYTYWVGMLTYLKEMLIDVSSHNDRPVQTITLVLQAFKSKGGFDSLNHILGTVTTDLKSNSLSTLPGKNAKQHTEQVRLELAVAVTRAILSLYSQLSNGKNVTESSQTTGLAHRSERDRSRPDYFSPSQFLVELRMAMLPPVRQLWESNLVDKAPCEISEKLIEVIRNIANADGESNAIKRSEKVAPPSTPAQKHFKVGTEHLNTLLREGYDQELSSEALFRCNNSLTFALEYCMEARQSDGLRLPVPEGELVPSPDANGSSPQPRTTASTGTATPDDQAPQINSILPNVSVSSILESLNHQMPPPSTPGNAAPVIVTENAPSYEFAVETTGESPSSIPRPSVSIVTERPAAVIEPQYKTVTIDDLNEERAAMRKDLVDRCLDVINAHGEVTFEIADLITTVVNKASDPAAQRKTASQILVVALMSFASEDDPRAYGKKIAAYAHLLALMLRDRYFYTAAHGELKENLPTLLSFIKLSPSHSSEEATPWIPHVLLIIEMLLSEDARPQKTKWTPPKDENESIEQPILEVSEPAIASEQRQQLLEAILDIMPRIGKDDALAVAVLRILVILTRTRAIAQVLGERKNIQRLFVMAKQLAGVNTSRIHSPLMLVLRHIIEDSETIKQIMRSDIKSFFDGARQQRTVDTLSYLRGLAPSALRAPKLFVEVTNEMVKFNRWNFQNPDTSNRHVSLVLKDPYAPSIDPSKSTVDSMLPAVHTTGELSIEDVAKPSTERLDSAMLDVASKPAAPEYKTPILEHPDGVIHFLLCELLNYKEVEDKDPNVVASTTVEKDKSTSNGDVAMGGISSAAEPTSTTDTAVFKSLAKRDFKAEEHPIYVYRCFILQCLSELLSSYNRTKIEFINFKRSSPPQAMTPSKPRSSVVNYLLFELIPVGTLDHPGSENSSLRKREVTSSWANSVLTALLSKTGEQLVDKSRESTDGEDEPDLNFVRRFVLENVLKAYKEASASSDPLDVKYARMLGLANLMTDIMSGKSNFGASDSPLGKRSRDQLQRIMYEKGFISALTTSIADIDLNFPGAKRAVKYILKPLRTLTSMAIKLSNLSLISAPPGHGDEEDIESATSVSEMDDEREETPDLFRNSTLGMFEPGREEDTSSDSDDDEEMYEGEYEDEMEYEEEADDDDEENISDDDEELEGMGPIEGLSGDVEVIMADDDGEEDDESSGDDGDEEGDSDMEDDDVRVEIIDEAGNIQQIAHDDDIAGEWESDDEDGDDIDEDDEAEDDGGRDELDVDGVDEVEDHVQRIGNIVRALGGDEGAVDMLERIEEQMQGLEAADDDERIAADYLDEIDDDEGDDEDMDEEEMLFEQRYAGGHPAPLSFEWEGDAESPMVGHNRHRHRSFHSGFPSLGREYRGDPLSIPDYPSYRSHRPGGPPQRSADDGVNPLLQRSQLNTDRNSGGRGAMGNWLQSYNGPNDILEIGFNERPITLGDGHASRAILNEVIRSLPLPGASVVRNGQGIQFHITGAPGTEFPRELQQLMGLSRVPRLDTRQENPEAGSFGFFAPQSTTVRWTEEVKLLFGPNFLEKTQDMKDTILAVLVPPAIDVDKTLKAAEAARARKLEEEVKKRAEEEKVAREKKEAEEKAEKERREADEREAAAKALAEANAAQDAEACTAEEDAAGPHEVVDAMDGLEATESQNEETTAREHQAEERARVFTIIRGSPFDITDLGIDPDFLAELPEELREEVIMSHVAERRSQAAATGAQPSDIDQEFLDALPDEIRDEIIQQERQDRRRREREEARRAAVNANGGLAANGGDMDPASILATLPPALRQQVLLEQDDDMIALLPPELAEQARMLQRANGHEHHGRIARRAGGPVAGEERDFATQRRPRRAIVQMLDKPGIATMLRLMFVLHGTLHEPLTAVLQNICQNRNNRTEVLGTLLHILQDGSMDMGAVERSFAHLSLKAKQPKEKDPKTPQPLKRMLSGIGTISQTSPEASPLLVVNQCLAMLVDLTQKIHQVPAFFLIEHDTSGSLKRSLSRKGKTKDAKGTKYALNSLLALLDRDLIMQSSSVMEQLSMLLNMITSPLQALQRKPKEGKDEPKTTEVDSAAADAPDTTTAPTEQLSEVLTTAAELPGAAVAEPILEQGISTRPEAVVAATTENDKVENATKEVEKKLRPMTYPAIPEHNLKLVINIFVARECSSKTFRETLSTIKNLSAIPGAKSIFGRELISKAQTLGELILVDLEELLPQIRKATTGTEIQGVALAKFSPGGSDQNKLLRVLTALDHLFDPKRSRKDVPENEAESESSQVAEKHDLLSSLYENSTFGPMWEKLSQCLSAIRQREHMLNVATILLPLIEALMVVCKNTTLKDAQAPRSQLNKEMLLTSPPPESRMESLFFTFTEEHRKILNELVRHTPKLMSGTFSLLVKNPKVLEFDNKRNYFSRSVHNKSSNTRQSYPPLQLSVRRDQVFHDSFKSLYFQTGDQMKYGKLNIRFHGEEGVDAGGVTREWFQVLSRQMFDPGYALFVPVSSDRTTFHPNQLSSVNEEHLMFFKFIGRIIGKALYEGRVLDCHFSRAVYKRILGKSVSVKDMESFDPDFYKSLIWMLENEITDIITETFSVDNDKFGVIETIDFIPNGRNVAVTEENKHEYVRLMVESKLTGSVKEQLDEFLKGFHDIIPAELIAIFNEQELELLISGLPEIDVDDWKSNTEYHNYNASSPQIQWFWRAVRSYDKEERAKLLQFVTGTSKVPLNGFKELEGMNGFSRFNIHRDYGNKDRLPSSHTCFNQLDLPEYESYENLRAQVLTAITAGSEYFGFA